CVCDTGYTGDGQRCELAPGGVEKFAVHPLSYDFGNIPIATKRTTTFVLSDDGTTQSRPLSLRLVALEGLSIGADTCSAKRLAPKTTCSFDLSVVASMPSRSLSAMVEIVGLGRDPIRVTATAVAQP